MIVIIVFIMTILLFGCSAPSNYFEGEGYKLNIDEAYPLPNEVRPDDALPPYALLPGDALTYVGLYETVQDVINYTHVSSGVITTQEKYDQSQINYELPLNFFDENFIFVTTKIYAQGLVADKMIAASYYENRLLIQLEYETKTYPALDRSRQYIYMYVFERSTLEWDLTFINPPASIYSVTKQNASKSTFLDIYFEDFINVEQIYLSFMNYYGITGYFFLEDFAYNRLTLRVSDELVSIIDVENIMIHALQDQYVVYYTLYNRYYKVVENKTLEDKHLIERGRNFGFNLNYDSTKGIEDNYVIVKSNQALETLMKNYYQANNINIDDELVKTYMTAKLEKYDDTYFSNHNLILFGIVASSGSFQYHIEIKTQEDVVFITLVKKTTIIITEDMAYYNVFVEVDKDYENFVFDERTIIIR